MDKQNVVYTYNEILLRCEKNEVLIRASVSMKLEEIMLSEIYQIQKDKYSIIPFF